LFLQPTAQAAVNGECSGRAVAGVHDAAYENLVDEVTGKVAAERTAQKETGPAAKKAKR
jgi:hypothetical protein